MATDHDDGIDEAKDDQIIAALLLLIADMLNLSTAVELPADQQSSLSHLALNIIGRRLKTLYFYLGSDVRAKANAALYLLAAIARHSTQAARDLVQAFDFTLSALTRLCKLPRQVFPTREKKGVGADEARRRLWRFWRSSDVQKRPSAALFVDFALALLQTADAQLLCTLLPARPIFAGLLHNLEHFPPEAVLSILTTLQDRVLDMGDAIPGQLQAEPFGDTALSQIAAVAAWEAPSADEEAASEAERVVSCAALAHQLLLDLATIPAHGLAPTSLDAQSAAEDIGGRKRLQRFMLGLRVMATKAHYDLLLAITAAQPTLAATYLANAGLSLEPRPSLKWWAGVSCLGNIIERASQIPLPFLEQAQRGGRPPSMDSGLVTGLMRRVFPACMPKVAISRGVQHSSPLVRYATLCTLRHMLDAFQLALASAREAAEWVDHHHASTASQQALSPSAATLDITAVSSPSKATAVTDATNLDSMAADAEPMEVDGGGVQDTEQGAAEDIVQQSGQSRLEQAHEQVQKKSTVGGNAWRGFMDRLRSAARGRLPDIQPLLALLAALQSQMQMQDNPHPMEVEDGGDAGIMAPGGLNSAEMTLVPLLAVLRGYLLCIPETFAEARFDTSRLLPENILDQPPIIQHGILGLLEASTSMHSHEASLSTGQVSSALLTPLLRLLCGSELPDISRTAETVLRHVLAEAVGFEDIPAEVDLWLDALPRRLGGPDQIRCADAVAGFVAQAVALLSRKPQEFHEAARAILSQAVFSFLSQHAIAALRSEYSLLVVAALRQAVRVTASSKMPADARAAIAGYVAGVVAGVVLVQANATPLAVLIIGLIRAEAAQLKANQPSAAARAHRSEAGTAAPKKRKLRGQADELEEKGKPDGTPLLLPTEAQPLASLMALAREILQGQDVPGSGTMHAPADDEVMAEAAQEKKRRRKKADAAVGSQSVGHPASSVLQPAKPDKLLTADVHVSGSDKAASQLSACLGSSISSAVSAVGLMELQTALLCAPAAAVAAEVPRLADLIMQQPDQAAKEMLVRVIQAHVGVFIDRIFADLLVADTAASTRKIVERLLDIFPAPMLLHALKKLPGETKTRVLERLHGRIQKTSPQKAIVPILAALACICQPSPPSTLTALFGLVSSALQAGSEASIHPHTSPAVVAAILKHPAVADYLNSPRDALCASASDKQITRLLLQMIAGRTAPGVSKDIDGIISQLTRPHLDRAVEAVLSAQLTQLQSPKRRPAVDACIALAAYLPLGQLTKLASHLLSAAAVDSTPQASRAPLVEAGLALADRLFAAEDADALPQTASISSADGSSAAVVKAVAALVGSNVSAAAERCLVQALHGRFSKPSIAAWSMSESAAVILKLCIAEPSGARCRLGTALVDALPPCRAEFCRLLPARLQQHDGKEALALLLPMISAYLRHASETHDSPEEDPVAKSCRDRLLTYMSSKRKPAGPKVLLSQSAAMSLDNFAAVALRRCLTISPRLDTVRTYEALQRLCPEDGWQLPAEQATLPGTQPPPPMIGPLPSQQAAIAAVLLHGLLERDGGDLAAAEYILRFALACTATLARVMKPQEADDKAAQLRMQLSGYMDMISRFISAQQHAVMSAEAFPALCAGIAKLTLAILRHRFDDAATVAHLRRLFAAFVLRNTKQDPDDHPDGGRSAEVAIMAARLAELLISHSRFVPMMLCNPGDTPLPLPKLAASLQRPLTSMLPLVELDPAEEAVMSGKGELVRLLGVLLKLQRLHFPGELPTTLQDGLRGLIPALLSGYGASCSSTDRAMLQLLLLVNNLLCEQESAESPAEDLAALHITSLFSGPLANAGFLWGPAAKADHKALAETEESVQRPSRAAIIKDTALLDARRCALSVIHFPEQTKLLLAIEEAEDSAMFSRCAPACSAAGYDPAFIIPFCVQGLRDGSLGCLDMANWGLLSLLLRTLASADDVLRGLAYEGLALYADSLESSNFREKAQLQLLMRTVKLSIDRPFQRLAALTALFLAEAACALAHPAAAMYPAVNRHLLRRASLDVQDAPLLKQLLSSGGQEQAAERLWLLRLLAAGFRSAADGDIFRRRFVAELLMSLHDSPLADAAMRGVALQTICSAPGSAPMYAADLVQHAGVVSWLSAVATDAVAKHGTAANLSSSLLPRVISALRGLLAAKVWKVKGRSGGLGVLDAFVKAASSLCRALAGSHYVCKDTSLAQNILGFASQMQQAALVGRPATAVPSFSLLAWADARALALQIGRPAEPETLGLLLQIVLALPPPHTDSAEGFKEVAAWTMDTCMHLLSVESAVEQPGGATSACKPWRDQEITPGQDLAARTILWLAACVASGAKLWDTSSGAASAAQLSVPGCYGRAQLIVQVYTALHPRLQRELKHPMLLLLAHMLQPAAAQLLGVPLDGLQAANQVNPMDMEHGGDKAGLQDGARWIFLLGNTLLRILGHLHLPEETGATALWFRAACPDQRSLVGSEGGMLRQESAKAAAELGLVMLSELCAHQPPRMTCSLLGRWAGGSEGPVKEEMAKLELQHARSSGLQLTA
ncbi:probable nucleolar pre-ribosomal-associated protein 1 at C-terminar half [Coccomyxa sp. Obi]|nr:probable nucleolar pre-ribosomal-associated protein 1 at C-terminar half [Coccomyxa sp. Obi]